MIEYVIAMKSGFSFIVKNKMSEKKFSLASRLISFQLTNHLESELLGSQEKPDPRIDYL